MRFNPLSFFFSLSLSLLAVEELDDDGGFASDKEEFIEDLKVLEEQGKFQ